MGGLPKLPSLPDPGNLFSIIDKANEVIDKGLGIVDKVTDKFDRAAEKIGPPEEKPPLTTEETPSPIATGTACIPCSRDHLSVASSALSEGLRFARDKGIRDPEVIRRIRIALDELNMMERIDLAPDEVVSLKGAEKELAIWTLNQSRNLRHAITAIKDAESMEQTAAKASAVTEEFMGRLWEIPEEECETCGEVRERLKEFIEKRKKERAGIVNP